MDAQRVTHVLDLLRERADCTVIPPEGAPDVVEGLTLPDDLATFYDLCGGVQIGHTGIQVVGPSRFLPINAVVLGHSYPDDPSDSWYLVAESARSATAERVSIDLRPSHLGRCYDSFWDRHGIAGSMPVVATSFTSLLEQLARATVAELPVLGDAYS